MKKSLALSGIAFAAIAAWLLMPEGTKKTGLPGPVAAVSARKTDAPAEKPEAPVPRHAPAAKAERKNSVPEEKEKQIKRIDIGKLVLDDGVAIKAEKKPDPFSKALASRDKQNMNLDMGEALPWPLPDSPVMPKNRDLGFHVGLDYRMNENLDLTGVAGVSVPRADPYSLKPNDEQIGVRARYRF